MAFTFDLSAIGDTLILSKIRLHSGDSVAGEGILPGGTNFQDDELLTLYHEEGRHVQRATAAALETAATRWSAYSGRYRLGPEDEAYGQAREFREQAAQLRGRFGYTADATTADAGAGLAINVLPSGKQS